MRTSSINDINFLYFERFFSDQMYLIVLIIPFLTNKILAQQYYKMEALYVS